MLALTLLLLDSDDILFFTYRNPNHTSKVNYLSLSNLLTFKNMPGVVVHTYDWSTWGLQACSSQ